MREKRRKYKYFNLFICHIKNLSTLLQAFARLIKFSKIFEEKFSKNHHSFKKNFFKIFFVKRLSKFFNGNFRTNLNRNIRMIK